MLRGGNKVEREERGMAWRAFKLVVRPLSALSLVVPLFGLVAVGAPATTPTAAGHPFMP
jgi:hypothetical protein